MGIARIIPGTQLDRADVERLQLFKYLVEGKLG